jgi:HEAT repeat protein
MRARHLFRSAALALALGAVGGPSPAHAFVWPNVPERIEKQLGSADPAERRLAAQELSRLPAALAKPLILKALADEDVEVRVFASAVAVRIKLEGAGDLVTPWLVEPDARVRLAACEVIRVSPSDRAVAALGRVLADPSKDVRLSAARAMGRSTSTEAPGLLLGHLDDNAPDVRQEVAVALGRLGDARAVLPLVGKVQDTDQGVRRVVARALGELGDMRATSALVLALNDSSLEVRVEAALALGRLGGDEAILALAPHAQAAGDGTKGSPSSESAHAMRQAALRALGRIGSPRAIDLLVAALSGDKPDAARTPARDALVSVGPRAVKPLVTFLTGSPSTDAAIGAVQALGAIGDPSASQPIVRGMQRGVVPVSAGLSALAELGSSDALPAVLELVAGQATSVRLEAIRAARELLDPTRPDGRAVDPLVDALSEPGLTIEERAGMLELLGRAGSPRGAATLLAHAGDKQTSVRRAVLAALGNLSEGSAAIDAKLVAALDDDLGTVRTEAAVSLSRVGTEAAAPLLLDRLLKSAEQDRAAVGLALSGVLGRSADAGLAKRVGKAVDAAPSSARDALIEGLGRMRTAASLEELGRLASGAVDDKRKVAESLAGQGERARKLTVQMASDPDAGVRANAAWTSGFVGDAEAGKLLGNLLRDPDAAVAGNAAAALGRLARTLQKADMASALCKALSDPRPYVRANALAGLDLAGHDCGGDPEAKLLADDPSDVVRAAAARHLHRLAVKQPAAVRALRRCVGEERVHRVARTCESMDGSQGGSRTFPLVVFVVPDGGAEPKGRAPFALVLPDGTMRLGLADRRGAVFEAHVPEGEVELAVPAPLALSRP